MSVTIGICGRVYGGLPEVEVINAVKVLRFHPSGGVLGSVFERWQRIRGGYRSASLVFGEDGIGLLLRKPLLVQLIERIVRINDFSEEDKASIYDAFDVFVLPSTAESFGVSYLEAWLCRKPVIGARIGPTQCVIDEGTDGLLVDPNDSQDIARAIIELLSDSNKRERMGSTGQAKTLSQFTWDKVTDKVENLYLELLAGKGTSYPSLAYQK